MATLQYVLPKKLLTQLAGALARREGGAATTSVIRWFIKRYGVVMNEAANPDPTAYKTFNDFFTRALKPGVRPFAEADFLCPVDGAISQFGAITGNAGDAIFQAKGHTYSTTALVGGDATLAKQFEHGHFATIYLSPKDYHRIHMPCDGELRRMIYVPGSLYSVNPATAREVAGLFAINERLVCVFDTPYGPFVNVLVGATIVGSMATVWHGVVNPRDGDGAMKQSASYLVSRYEHAFHLIPPADPSTITVREWIYKPGEVVLKKGDEMGRFLLGSTVVMLWPKDTITFNETWSPARGVRMGERMGMRKV
jgi:phosphatidylserine decarboxylase